MQIIRDLDKNHPFEKGTVIALGNFDGVHRGHQAILAECAALAKAHSVPSAVMTFEPHPREFFTPGHKPLRIHSFRQKIEAIKKCGIGHVLVMRFNKRFAATSANDFVENILKKSLSVKHVVTGYNFAFGKGRAGDSKFLTDKARELNFGFTAHEQVLDEHGKIVSSSGIRQMLSQGNIAEASRMLGHPYRILGHVMHGQKRGRILGYPTINISLKKLFKPRFGVYAARVKFAGEDMWYKAAVNIGINPTFSVENPLLEAHCFGMNRDVYGRLASVELDEFIREEIKFETMDLLKKQMDEDSKKILGLLE